MNQPFHRAQCLLLLLLYTAIAAAQPAGMIGSQLRNNPPIWKKQIPISPARNQSGIDCNTWTFRVRLHNTTTKTLADVISLPDQSFIIAGSDMNTGVGFIAKTNNDGTLLTAQQFWQFNKTVSFKKIKHFSSGYIYILAEITDQLTNITRPFIIVTDVSGNVEWYKEVSVSGIAGSWHAVELDEWKENSFSLFITNDSLINVSRLQMDGTVTWSKTFKAKNKPEGISILNDYYDTYIAYNEIDSGYHKGVILDIGDDGAYKYGYKIGGSIDNSEYIMQSMRLINLRPRIMALQKRSGTDSLVRLNCDPLARPAFKEIFSGSFIANDALRGYQSEWGEVIGSSNTGSSDVYLTMTFPDNLLDPIRSKLISYPYPVQLSAVTRAFDGGSLIGAVSGDGNDVILTKVDSSGMLPVCGSTDALAVLSWSQLASRAETLPLLPNQAQLIISALNHTAYDVSVVDECRTLYCPNVPEPDTCLRTFFREYRNNSNSMWMQHIKRTNDTLLLIGRMRMTPYIADEKPVIITMDTLGKMINAKIFSEDRRIDFSTTIKLRDGNFLSCGYVYYSYSYIEQFIIKYTPQLNILWQKRLFSPDQFRNIADVIESQEGDIYCYVADKLNSTSEKRHLMKLSATGDPVWFKSYTAGSNLFLGAGEAYAKIVELGNFIYLKYNEETNDWSPHLIKISKADGSVAWVKKYVIPNVNTSFYLDAMIPNDNHIYLFAVSDAKNLFMKIAEDGTLTLCKRSVNNIGGGGTVKKSDGLFMLGSGVSNWPASNFGVFEIDTAFNIHRQQYIQIPKDGQSNSIIPFNDSVTYGTGSFFYSNPYWASFSFEKFNFNSSFGSCTVTDFPLTLENFPLNVINKTTIVASLTLPQTDATNGSFTDAYVGYSAYYCGNVPVCTNIDLTGNASICDSVNIYTYRVQRNPGCNGIIKWNIDTVPGRVRIIALTDSTIRIKALASGPIMIRAKIFASCEWIEDSLQVDLSISPAGVLDIGPDTVLCPGNTVLLNARSGYTTYQWQDGSTDSVFLVSSPGIYYVDVTSCGNTYRDSVLVSPHPPIPFDAGPDRVKCNSDTIHLQAPNGFLNYNWSPGYNISSVNTQNVIINPLIDTVYYIKGEKTPGCFAFDTIRITVHHSQPVSLGNDTSFCFGQFILLNAGNDFSTYQWSNGSNTQQIIANAAGNYSVIAATAQGCKSFDTLKVLNVFSNPIVTLSDKPQICAGSTVTFDPGNFSSYLWNTASTSRTIMVGTPGIYYVTVTDGNQCKGTDTTEVLAILPLPAGFLPFDTTICSYGKLEIRSTGVYNSYLWNNNALGSSITVTAPGLYWLQVTDNDHCTGKDSIIVNPKDCMKGFYIPDAFTPNDDGNNDDFKPLLFGNIKQYRFMIYNRWGEKIFESTQPGKGWNGMVGGIKQDTNVFIWMCTFQFTGEQAETRKGRVVLIR